MSREAIIVLTPGFPGSEAETDCLPPVQAFVRALAARDPHTALHVVAFQYPHKQSVYNWHGATVHALNGRNRRFPARLLNWFTAERRIHALGRQHRIVALHSMWLAECSYVAARIAQNASLRHIGTIRGQDALATNPYLKRLPLDRMTITAGSATAAEQFRQNTGRKVDAIIPTGLDPRDIAQGVPPSARPIDILGVGSLSSIKDFVTFLEIVSVLKDKHPDLRARIVGEGPERPQLEQMRASLHLDHTVSLAGRLPREGVLDEMRQAKILLHTSSYEGQGYVLLEALGSGARVVCRETGYSGAGPGAYRCDTKEQMIESLLGLLSAKLPRLNVQVPLIDQTVTAFEGLYRS